jgi:hypothetical protein
MKTKTKSKFQTPEIKKLSEIIFDLEIENQRTVHSSEPYTILNSQIETERLNELHNNLFNALKNLDNFLLHSIDDGK